jgi:hypothetical protein
VRTLLHGAPVREAPLPAMILAIAAAALLALVAAPVAPAAGALAAAGTAAAALFALWHGWYVPPAALLATILGALIASRVLGRAPAAPAATP